VLNQNLAGTAARTIPVTTICALPVAIIVSHSRSMNEFNGFEKNSPDREIHVFNAPGISRVLPSEDESLLPKLLQFHTSICDL
jgi:hypothetical protein